MGDDILRRRFVVHYLIALMLLLALGWAGADEADKTEAGLPEWELGLGVAAYNLPAYRGSADRTTSPLPYPYVVYRGERLRIDRAIEGILFESDRLKLDVSGRASPLVESDESDAREGMPDLDSTVEVGPSLEYLFSNPSDARRLTGILAMRAVASVDYGDFDVSQQGWVIEPSVAYQRPLAGFQLGVQAGVLFATEDYHRYFYDVDAEFATAERPEYRSDGGYSGAYLTAGLAQRRGRLRWGVYARYDNLHGVAFEDSPLVESKDDFLIGVSVAWVLAESKKRVAPKSIGPGALFEIPLFSQ